MKKKSSTSKPRAKARVLVIKPAPKPRVYVPKRKTKDGKFVPLKTERKVWTPECTRVVSEVWKVMHALPYNQLKQLPWQEWNRLMDILPVCECGRTIAPSRARWVHRLIDAACSDVCAALQRSRKDDHRTKVRIRQKALEAQSMADALDQG